MADETKLHARLMCLQRAVEIAKETGERDVNKIVKTAELFAGFVEGDGVETSAPYNYGDEIPF